MTRWFNRGNNHQSPDTTNGRQLRRQTRLNKAFARSRDSWRPRIATGFMITTLIVDECYCARRHVARTRPYTTRWWLCATDSTGRLEIAHPTVRWRDG